MFVAQIIRAVAVQFCLPENHCLPHNSKIGYCHAMAYGFLRLWHSFSRNVRFTFRVMKVNQNTPGTRLLRGWGSKYNIMKILLSSYLCCKRKIIRNCMTLPVTIQNGWNNRISDGCVYAQIRRGLGMHLVTYSNHDTVLFLLIVPIKRRFV